MRAIPISTPSRPQLRELLKRLFGTDSELDAFMGDYFPQTHQRIGPTPDRVAKVNLFFQLVTPEDIWVLLKKNHEAQVAKHVDILITEPDPSVASRRELIARTLEQRLMALDICRACGNPAEQIEEDIVRLRRELRHGRQVVEQEVLCNRYCLMERIGVGGVASVWIARDRRLEGCESAVAVKILKGQHAENTTFVRKFRRAAELMRKLEHPSIVRVLDGPYEDGGPHDEDKVHFFVMEYVSGNDLKTAIETQQIDINRRIEVILQIGTALQFVHDQKLIHRDVTPSNIIVSHEGLAKLTDFDLIFHEDHSTLVGGQFHGKYPFMAPELFDDEIRAVIDPRIDVFALGMTTLFALSGKTIQPTKLERRLPELVDRLPYSALVKKVLLVALAEEPTRRFPTIQAFCDDLALAWKQCDQDIRYSALRDGMGDSAPALPSEPVALKAALLAPSCDPGAAELALSTCENLQPEDLQLIEPGLDARQEFCVEDAVPGEIADSLPACRSEPVPSDMALLALPCEPAGGNLQPEDLQPNEPGGSVSQEACADAVAPENFAGLVMPDLGERQANALNIGVEFLDSQSNPTEAFKYCTSTGIVSDSGDILFHAESPESPQTTQQTSTSPVGFDRIDAIALGILPLDPVLSLSIKRTENLQLSLIESASSKVAALTLGELSTSLPPGPGGAILSRGWIFFSVLTMVLLLSVARVMWLMLPPATGYGVHRAESEELIKRSETDDWDARDLDKLFPVPQESSHIFPRPEPPMIIINRGSFLPSFLGRGQEPVIVDTFSIDKFEVSVEIYRQCVKYGICTRPTKLEEGCNWNYVGNDQYPMDCVTWEQAQLFCHWLDRRLPSEAEWEFAARGIAERVYPWGNDEPTDQPCWKRKQTCRIGTHATGATPEGVQDMAGNVWEWVDNTWCERYQINCGELSQGRILRGGESRMWQSAFLRNDHRAILSADEARQSFGFRCARNRGR